MEQQEVEQRKPGGPRRSVLIVEDHPPTRNALREYLEEMGFDTVDAADGRTALQRLGDCIPDLVCLDLVLPETSGYEICEYIRQSPRHRSTPVLVVSGRVLPTDRAHAAAAGADGFLAKPFSGEELRAQVETLMMRLDRGGQQEQGRREDGAAA